MQRRIFRGATTLLFLCLVLSAFYMREASQPDYVQIPVAQVLSYTNTPLSSAENYQADRSAQRETEMTALSILAQSGDQAAGAHLQTLVKWAEVELAVEAALDGLGYADAICAVREEVVFICIQEALDEEKAQRVIEVSEKITGECAENVFILDECGYS